MDKPPTQPNATARATAERLARQAREAAALRENLRRRRTQAQALQAAASAAEEAAAPHPGPPHEGEGEDLCR